MSKQLWKKWLDELSEYFRQLELVEKKFGISFYFVHDNMCKDIVKFRDKKGVIVFSVDSFTSNNRQIKKIPFVCDFSKIDSCRQPGKIFLSLLLKYQSLEEYCKKPNNDCSQDEINALEETNKVYENIIEHMDYFQELFPSIKSYLETLTYSQLLKDICDITTRIPKDDLLFLLYESGLRSDVILLCHLDKLFIERCEVPFDCDYDQVIEKLSFTAKTIDNKDIKKGWGNFYESCCQDLLDYPELLGLGMWYFDKEKYYHAASIFEYCLGNYEYEVIKEGTDEDIYIWLRYLAECYEAIGEYERARLYLERLLDVHVWGKVADKDKPKYVDSICRLSQVIIKNREQESEKIRNEVDLKMKNCIGNNLWDILDERTKQNLIDAELLRQKNIINNWPLPYLNILRKAIEEELEKKWNIKQGNLWYLIDEYKVNVPCENEHYQQFKQFISRMKGKSNIQSTEMQFFLKKFQKLRNDVTHRSLDNDEFEDFLQLLESGRYLRNLLDSIQPKGT